MCFFRVAILKPKRLYHQYHHPKPIMPASCTHVPDTVVRTCTCTRPSPPGTRCHPPLCTPPTCQARSKIVQRAEALGIDWQGTMRELQAQDWSELRRGVEDPSVSYPPYYVAPFHAYSQVCTIGRQEVQRVGVEGWVREATDGWHLWPWTARHGWRGLSRAGERGGKRQQGRAES